MSDSGREPMLRSREGHDPQARWNGDVNTQHQDRVDLRRELCEIVQRMRYGRTTDQDADIIARELRLDAPLTQPRDY